MSFNFGRKKSQPEDMRMHYHAPSFFIDGETLPVWTLSELKAESQKLRGKVLLLHPGFNLLSSPREWAGVLSEAAWVVISSKRDDKNVEVFRRELEKLAFSPIRHHIDGVSVAFSKEEAEEILSRVSQGRGTIIIDNTGEVDL